MTYLYTFDFIVPFAEASERVEQSRNKGPHSNRVIMEGRRRGRYRRQMMAIVVVVDGSYFSGLKGEKKTTNPPQTPRLPLDVCWRFAQALARECVEALFFPFSLPLPFQHLAEPLIQVNSRRFNPVTKRETKCCLNKRLWAVNGRAVRKAGFDPRSGGKLRRRSLWRSAGRRSQL